MPLRNLFVIVLASIISVVCYGKTQRNRFAALFAEAMDQVSMRYVEEVEPRTLFEGAMDGMLGRLDDYSSYIGPDDYREFLESLDQEFAGIGIMVELNQQTHRLTVLSPLVDTPAYQAGMRAGDTILEVDGKSTEGATLRDAVELLRGEPDTDVRLKVLHKGDEEPVEFTITRAVIQVPSVLGDTRRPDGSWNFVLEKNPQIGYVRITTFGEHTVRELTEALDSCKQQNVNALVIDVRNNAGGLLETAIATCDMFIDKGLVVSTRGRGGKLWREYPAHASKSRIGQDLPLVVLANRYSASASEIVAACLQDHGRAVIVGERTWGKGTVQNLIHLEMGKSVLRLTTATYWRPSEKNIHRSKNASDEDDWGVMPNQGFEVELSEEEFTKVFKQRQRRDYMDTRDQDNPNRDVGERTTSSGQSSGGAENGDAEAEEPFDDPQLSKAIDYLEQTLKLREDHV